MCIFLRIVVGIKKNETEDWFIHLSPFSDNFSFSASLHPLSFFYPLFSPSPTPPPSGSLCFISYLINSSEVQPFTLNPHLPVHMATGWPPITHSTLDCSSETASDHCGPLYLKHILTHTRGNRADQRLNVFFLLSRSSKFLLEVIWNVDFSTALVVIVTQFDICNY